MDFFMVWAPKTWGRSVRKKAISSQKNCNSYVKIAAKWLSARKICNLHAKFVTKGKKGVMGVD